MAKPQALQSANRAEPPVWMVPSVRVELPAQMESTQTVPRLHQVSRSRMRQVLLLVVRGQLRVVAGLVLGETELRLRPVRLRPVRLRPVQLLPGWEVLQPVVREWLRLLALLLALVSVVLPEGLLGWPIFGGCGLRFWRR